MEVLPTGNVEVPLGLVVSPQVRDGGEHPNLDVLAPEGLGSRADITTTPPGRILQVPGGTQAIARTELLPIAAGDYEGLVYRPSLLGAIIIKAAAVDADATEAASSGTSTTATPVGASAPRIRSAYCGSRHRSSSRDWIRTRHRRGAPATKHKHPQGDQQPDQHTTPRKRSGSHNKPSPSPPDKRRLKPRLPSPYIPRVGSVAPYADSVSLEVTSANGD